MYKVLCDNALMCDSRIEELALINPVVILEENKAGSFTFTIPPTHPKYDSIKKRKTLVQVYHDKELIFSGVCIEETKNFFKQQTVYCEGELTYFNDSVQRPARYQNITVRGLLEAYIENHNEQVEEAKKFKVGIVTVEDSNDSLYCYTNMDSTMKSLKEDLVDDLGGFFRVRYVDGVRYLDYLAESQNTNTQVVRIGKNLMDFSSNIDSSEIATAIIPLGCRTEISPIEGLEVRLTIESVNDGLDYVYSPDAVDTYGWIYKSVKWDDVTVPSILKIKGEKYLSDIQFENMVIEAKAVDLHLTDKDIEQFKISDQIRVVSKPHGLDRYFRLTKMTIYLNNPENNKITLGKDESLTLSAKTNQENEALKKSIDSIVPPSTILKSAMENATQLIQNSMNGYITTVMNENGSPKELLIMDTDSIETATKVWRWNVNGLGYSSTGYEGEYNLAMTMDGSIVADRITTGTMFADRIRGGKLTVGGFDNLNGVIEILNSDGENVGVIDNNGIALYSKTSGIQIILSPLVGFVQRDADGNEFYGLIYDEVVGGFPQYSQTIRITTYTGIDSDTINKEIIDTKTEEYWIAEPVPPYFSGTKGKRVYKKYRYYYTHNLAYWKNSFEYPSDYTSITVNMPNSFKGKQWVVRVQIDSIDTSIVDNYLRYDNFNYEELPCCYEGYETTSSDWVLYSDDGNISSIVNPNDEDYEAKNRLINMEKTNKTTYLTRPDPASGNTAISSDKFKNLTVDDVNIDFYHEYDEEIGTVTVYVKATTKTEGYCVNELIKFRVYVVC